MLGQFKGPAGLWDFGDGVFVATGVDANGGRLFGPGTYNIRFKSSPAGPITDVGIIKVNASPVANFKVTSATSGCAPLTVDFEDTTPAVAGAPIVKRIWDFGPTGKQEVGNTTSYTYLIPGTYTVKLIAETSKGCKSSVEKIKIITVTKSPSVSFNIVKDKSCGPFTAEAVNTSTGVSPGATYTWQAFDPTGTEIPVTINGLGKPTFLCSVEGAYKMRLKVTEATGCETTVDKNNAVVIAENSLVGPYGSSYVLSASSGACSSVNGEFTSLWKNSNVAGQSVDWEIESPSGNITTRNNIQNLTGGSRFSFSTPGQWKVRVKASGGNFGCPPSGPFEQLIDISLGTAVARFTMQDSVNCTVPTTVKFFAQSDPNNVKYEWDFDNNGSIDATGINATRNYTTYGNKNVRLIVTDAQGCKSESVRNGDIKLSKITPRLGAWLTFGCNDANGDFVVNFIDSTSSATPITKWKWEFFDASNALVGTIEGTDPAIHKNPSFTFHTNAADGKATYWARLTVSTDNGCSETYSTIKNYIRVGDKPVASFTANPPYGCPHTQVNFTYTGSQPFDSLFWFPVGYGGQRITRRTNDNPDYSYNYNENPGTYVAGLVVWNGGCPDSTRYTIQNPTDPRFLQLAPKARASWFRDECKPGGVYFTDGSMGAQYWRWDFGTGSVVNPYPAGKAVRDYLPGQVPTDVRNPIVNYPAGNYTASLHVEADNIYYVTDALTGARLRNKRFLATGNETTYTTNAMGQPLWFGSVTTGDSVVFIRCEDDVTLNITVSNLGALDANISSNYDATKPNCFPVVVNFSNNTAGATSWYWLLGNGQVSYEQNPSNVTYAYPGKYTVELVVTTAGGCKYQKIYPDYVHVKGPLVNFDYCEADICIGQNMQFKDLTTTGETIQYRTWDMGNGVVFSNDPGVSSAAPPAGAAADLSAFNYTYPAVLPSPALQIDGIPVTLTITEAGGCKSFKKVIIRPTMPQPDFDITTTVVSCDESEVKVTVTDPEKKGFAPFRYTWQVFKKGTLAPVVASSGPDGNGSPTFRLKSKSGTEEQEYDIRLQLEDFKYRENGTGTGCLAEITKTVIVKPGKMKVDFTYDDPGLCPPLKVQFYDKSEPQADIVAWDWDFGDGSHSNIKEPLKIYGTPNENGYTVSLTVTDKTGCKQTYVNPSPIVIQGIDGTFTIQQIDGSKGPGPVLTDGATVDFVYKLPFVTKNYTVQFNAVVAASDLPKVGYYIWDFGEGTEVTTSPTTTHTYTTPNIYSPRLVIVSKEGCWFKAFADLYVVANDCGGPEITIAPKKCFGEKITLNGIPPTNAVGVLEVTWTNLTDNTVLYNGSGLTDVPAIDIALTHKINVLLTITDEGGCTSWDVKSFDVHKEMFADAGEDQMICQGSDATLTGTATEGSGNYTYTWTSSDGVVKVGDKPVYSGLTATTTFNLLVKDNITNCTAVDKVTVIVNPPPTVKISDDDEICSGSSTLLTAVAAGGTGTVSQYTYKWTAGPGPGGALSPMTALETDDSPGTLFTIDNLTAVNNVYSYFVTVTDELGCTATDEVKITVTPGLTITLNDPGIICRGESKQLTGTIIGGTGVASNLSYTWTKASGNGNSGEIDNVNAFNPNVTPTDLVTTYHLEVMETVNGVVRCGGAKDVTINLNTPIVIKIDAVAPQCFGTTNVPLVAHVTGGSGVYAYEWTRLPLPSPAGVLKDDTKSTAYINLIQGDAEYMLRVIDTKILGASCMAESIIIVRSVLPLADATPVSDICIGESTYLQGTGSNGTAPYKFTWSLVSRPPVVAGGDADGLKDADVTAKADKPEFLAGNPAGTYVYALVVTDKQGCTSNNLMQVSVKVNPLPDPPVITGRLEYCQGETIHLTASGLPSGIFKWYSSSSLDASMQFFQGAIYETLAIGYVTYYVTQTNPLTGCVSPPQMVRVKVNPIPDAPLVEAPAPYCPGNAIAPLTAQRTVDGAILKWYSDIDLTELLYTGDVLVTGMPSVAGAKTFYVTQTAGGCQGPPAAIEIKVNPTPPAPKVFAPEPYCEGEVIAPLAALGSNLKWYADLALTKKIAEGESFDTKVPSVVGMTTFYVTQTDLGCEGPPAVVTIEVKSMPVSSGHKPITFCFEGGKRLMLNAGPGYAFYEWEHDGTVTQTVEITQEGTYYVNVMNEFKCPVRDSIVVTELCPPRIFVPSAFTPDGDGMNDVLQVFGRHFYDLEMTIFNRWGEIVYIGKGQESPWNGMYREVLAPLGTYPWKLKAKAKIDDSIIEMSGKVTLIR